MFGFLGGSEQLLYVLGDLFGLTNDVLRARHGAVFPALLSWLRCIGTWEGAAAEESRLVKMQVQTSQIIASTALNTLFTLIKGNDAALDN